MLVRNMHTGQLLLLLALLCSIVFASQDSCTPDPECITWSDLSNFDNVPHKVTGPCCPKRVAQDRTCHLDQDSWDPDTRLCASFAPETVEYIWGREVPYFEVRACAFNTNCVVSPKSVTFSTVPALPPQVAGPEAIEYSVSDSQCDDLRSTNANTV